MVTVNIHDVEGVGQSWILQIVCSCCTGFEGHPGPVQVLFLLLFPPPHDRLHAEGSLHSLQEVPAESDYILNHIKLETFLKKKLKKLNYILSYSKDKNYYSIWNHSSLKMFFNYVYIFSINMHKQPVYWAKDSQWCHVYLYLMMMLYFIIV